MKLGDSIGIILSAGIGNRMNSDIPKQYLELLGQQVIQYSIDAFKQSTALDDFIVVTDSETNMKKVRDRFEVNTILGGSTRNESFSNALKYISDTYDCGYIFVNESARPLITPRLIDEFMDLIRGYDCVYCVKEITDSLETKTGQYVKRSEYELVMSPEAYRFETIYKYFDSNSETTFPGHMIPDGFRKFRYTDYRQNVKLTYPEDLVLLESIMNRNRIRQ